MYCGAKVKLNFPMSNEDNLENDIVATVIVVVTPTEVRYKGVRERPWGKYEDDIINPIQKPHHQSSYENIQIYSGLMNKEIIRAIVNNSVMMALTISLFINLKSDLEVFIAWLMVRLPNTRLSPTLIVVSRLLMSLGLMEHLYVEDLVIAVGEVAEIMVMAARMYRGPKAKLNFPKSNENNLENEELNLELTLVSQGVNEIV
ncbi:hypothetical protein RDI58_005175 [Solanum bulbocastanum]|uniref:Uncharacterized protein n=1 Tax=Solanum bulbocastanum TaxID=147425 RepID=A0AAN8YQP9_SOLBU